MHRIAWSGDGAFALEWTSEEAKEDAVVGGSERWRARLARRE